jgi:hypothetical protein
MPTWSDFITQQVVTIHQAVQKVLQSLGLARNGAAVNSMLARAKVVTTSLRNGRHRSGVHDKPPRSSPGYLS